MRSVVPFQQEHLARLMAQGVQRAQIIQVSPEVLRTAAMMAEFGPAFTALDGERVIACSGVITGGAPVGTVWAIVSAEASRHMLWLHRATERYLDALIASRRLRRLEATVEEGFRQGCRWMDLLGFEFEGRMRNYGDRGETHLRYARIGAAHG